MKGSARQRACTEKPCPTF